MLIFSFFLKNGAVLYGVWCVLIFSFFFLFFCSFSFCSLFPFFPFFPSPTGTVMTFNKGGSWNLLNPPVTDSRGAGTNCFPTAGCSLHIHGTSDYWGPFYSLDSAIGLAMATGKESVF